MPSPIRPPKFSILGALQRILVESIDAKKGDN